MARRKHIDTTPFEAVMAEALVAYSRDSGYAISMARTAVVIANKQRIWTHRKAVRSAEAAAIAACATEPEFLCENSSACGSGPGCRFSTRELALLEVGHRPGESVRPQPHVNGPTYSSEPTVYALAELLEPPRRPA